MSPDRTAVDTAPLRVRRSFNARREEVWLAWTDPRLIAQWWSPEVFDVPSCAVDVRAGGDIRIDMRAPDGTIYPMSGTFVEVTPMDRLAFRTTPLDSAGEPMFEVLHTATFTTDGESTQFTLDAEVLWVSPAALPHLAGMEMGWNQSLDKLERLVAPPKAG